MLTVIFFLYITIMDLPANFEYFERKTTDIAEKLIQQQGPEVCRKIINENYINIQTKEYDFGFIHKTRIAQIGRTRSRTTRTEHVYSFILCKIQSVLNSLDISLICSRETAKDGKKLVELAYQKAKELNIRYLSLLSINNDKVLKWYKAQGFILTSETRNVDGTIKAYYMVKPIT